MGRKPVIVNLIILINICVFLMWTFSLPDAAFMEENFLVSWDALNKGRYWTLVTSAFSHNLFLHIFLNMYVLRSFGGLIEEFLGPFNLVKFYLFASIVSSVSHSAVSAFILNIPEQPALGASGAIAGLVLIFSLMFPKQPILLLGFIPMPALLGALAFVGLDIWGLIAQAEGGGLPIGHGAHMGGAFAGAIYYFFRIRPRMRIRRNFVA